MLSTSSSILHNRKNTAILKFLFFSILAVYLADCFSPLRLHYDSVRYLAIKDCLELGCPADSDAATDYFPFGYTAMLLVLSKLGILSSFSIVFTNCLFLLGCLYFTSKVFEKSVQPYLLYVIVLLSWLFIKFVAHPLSEMQYLFFSMGAVFFFYRFTSKRNILYLLFSILFCWLAFVTKTVGITLVGAIAIGLMWEFKTHLAFLARYKFLIAGLLLSLGAAVILFAKQLGLNHYTGVLNSHLNEAPFFTRLSWRFIEWGEMFLNTPSNKIFNLLPRFGNIIFIAVGFLLFCWFCMILFSKKSRIPVLLKAYFIFYCIIMFNWPFNDPRFWVPMLPMMAAVVLQASFTSLLMKVLSRIMLSVYIALGIVAAAYMVFSSFNHPFFAKNQANGSYQKEYEIHFSGKPDPSAYTTSSTDTLRTQNVGGSIKTYNPYILGLLQRYSR